MILVPVVLIFLGLNLFSQLVKADDVRSITFPVLGGGSYSNDFYAARSGGIHGATDIFAPKHTPLVSPVNGTVTSVQVPQPSWGYSVSITDADGYVYRFIHMNNDNPGTDDGSGGPMNAYAPDMKVGNPVVAGQHVGYVGDSGNAENTSPHLHFEIFYPDGSLLNPYHSLNAAPRINTVVQYPELPNELLPYGPSLNWVSLDMGNFEGTAGSASEIITGSGAGDSLVKIYRQDETLVTSLYAIGPGFAQGIDVAAGDVDGDGIDEIIAGALGGTTPQVVVRKLDGTLLADFNAFDPSFRGGVRVSAGDVDGDGMDEIIIGSGPGMPARVIARKLDGTIVSNFTPYGGFTGAVDVAGGDVEGSTADEIITGIGAGGGSEVTYWRPDATMIESFRAYAGYDGGVRISAGNVTSSFPKDEVVAVPESRGPPFARIFNLYGGIIKESSFTETWWIGYYEVGAGNGAARAATFANRRASIRPVSVSPIGTIRNWKHISTSYSSGSAQMSPGQTQTITVVAKNTSNVNWTRTGTNPVRLATFNPTNRTSAFEHSSWFSPIRPALMTEATVVPGANGTFTFTVQAPSQLGEYREGFNLVAEGASWLPDQGLSVYFNVSQGYAWGVTAQSANGSPYTSGLTMSPGETQSFTLTARNTGITTWSNSTNPVRLATFRPTNRTSQFQDPGWVLPARPAVLTEPTVAPGGDGTLTFNLKAPTTPGVYREHFNLVAEGISWFPDINHYLLITVRNNFIYQPNSQKYNTGGGETEGLAFSMARNSTATIKVTVRNTGSTTWSNSTNPVRLATFNPTNRTSAFQHPSWILPARPAVLQEASVPTNGLGTFIFTINAPATPGFYREYFNLVAEGLSWFPDTGLRFDITVN